MSEKTNIGSTISKVDVSDHENTYTCEMVGCDSIDIVVEFKLDLLKFVGRNGRDGSIWICRDCARKIGVCV